LAGFLDETKKQDANNESNIDAEEVVSKKGKHIQTA